MKLSKVFIFLFLVLALSSYAYALTCPDILEPLCDFFGVGDAPVNETIITPIPEVLISHSIFEYSQQTNGHWEISLTGNESKWVNTTEIIDNGDNYTIKVTSKNLADRTYDECEGWNGIECTKTKKVIYNIPDGVKVKDKDGIEIGNTTKKPVDYFEYTFDKETKYLKLGEQSITLTYVYSGDTGFPRTNITFNSTTARITNYSTNYSAWGLFAFPFVSVNQTGTDTGVRITCNGTTPTNTSINGSIYYSSVGNNTGYSVNDGYLVAYYHADGDANDYSGYGRNGINQGNVPYSSGVFNSSFGFNAINTTYIQVPHNNSLNNNGTGGYSVSLWMKLNQDFNVASSPTVGLVAKRMTDGSSDGWILDLCNTADCGSTFRGILLFNDDGVTTAGAGTNTLHNLTAGGWHHIAATFNGTWMWIYEDGVEKINKSVAVRPANVNTANLTIGRERDNAATALNGSLDEIMIFNRSLSLAEVQSLYISGSTKYNDISLSAGVNWTKTSELNCPIDSTSNGATFPNSTNKILFEPILKSNSFNSYSPTLRAYTYKTYEDRGAFISGWDTNRSGGATNSSQIRLPLEATGVYDFTVDWGDGTTDNVISSTGAGNNHTYAVSGNYTVSITGIIRGWRFNNVGDKTKITNITQWGSLRLGNNNGYFYGCSNLNITATDNLDMTGTTTMASAFRGSGITTVPSMNSWDMSLVTSMSNTFNAATNFNQNISNWDTSQVTAMDSMFRSTNFNQSIGNWDTSKVTAMNSMFQANPVFDQPINNWNVSNVAIMNNMFSSATKFNQNISNWDTHSATTMASMFNVATNFDQPLGTWNVSKVTTMASMFSSVTLSTENYDNLLNGWAGLSPNLINDTIFHGGSSKYCLGETARNTTLIGYHNWTITDGGKLSTCDLNAPAINFTLPTPSNGTTQSQTYVTINVSISEETNISSIVYNWNGTNFTYYNDSLVLAYNFDNLSSLGESNTKVVDISKYGNDATVNGAVFSPNESKYGGAYQFDGINDYLNISGTTAASMTQNMTVAFWIKYINHSAGASVVISSYISPTGWKYLSRWYNDGSGSFAINNGGGGGWTGPTFSAGTIPNGIWTHFVFSKLGTNASVYVNGVTINSSITTAIMLTGSPIHIGKRADGNFEFFNGSIDEVRIWNRSLSSAEIYQQYVSNLNKFNSTQWYLYVNQSKNATTGLDTGTYTYQAFASDTSNNLNSTEQRTITIQSPPQTYNVTLVYPLNATTVDKSINLTYNVSVPMDNCSLWINDTGTYHVNQTWDGQTGYGISPNINQTWNISVFTDGNYIWNTQCFYNLSPYTEYWAGWNWTFTISTNASPCACPSVNTNWKIEQYCALTTTCNIGTGILNITASGTLNISGAGTMLNVSKIVYSNSTATPTRRLILNIGAWIRQWQR